MAAVVTKSVARKALEFVGENVGNSSLGKVFDWALDKVSDDESEEAKHTARAEKAQALLAGVQGDAEAAIVRQKVLVDGNKAAITKLTAAIDSQQGDLTKVWADVNSTASKMKMQEVTLDKIEWSFERLSDDMQNAMVDFNWELRQIDDMQQTVKNQLDRLASKMKSDVKIALAEHEAWTAQSNIVKFYEEFELHVSVAVAQVESGEFKTLGDSPNIKAFVAALRSPVSGVAYELFNLKCAYALLDNEPSSSRYAIEASVKEAIIHSRSSGDATREKVQEEYARGLQALMGAQITAYILIGFIAPNRIYRRKHAQAALDDLVSGYTRLFNLLPSSMNADRSWLFERDGKAPSYRAWYIYTSRGLPIVFRYNTIPPFEGAEFWDGPSLCTMLVWYTRAEITWVFKPSSEHPGLVNLVTFTNGSTGRRVLSWNPSNRWGRASFEMADEAKGTNVHFKLDVIDDADFSVLGASFGNGLKHPKPITAVRLSNPDQSQDNFIQADAPEGQTLYLVEIDMKQQRQAELEAWESRTRSGRELPTRGPPTYTWA